MVCERIGDDRTCVFIPQKSVCVCVYQVLCSDPGALANGEGEKLQSSKADDNVFATENILITDAKKISMEMIQLTV